LAHRPSWIEDTIEEEAIVQQVYGLAIPQTLEEACDPRRLALLVYDMQIGVISQLADGERVTAQVLRVLRAAREAGVRVVFSRHLSLPKELMGVAQFRMAMAWQHVASPEQVQPWFLRDAPGFQLVPDVAPRPSEAILDKITMSAFEGTPFDIALRDCGVNAVAVVGVAMEVGIDPTVRHAADLGYIPIVVTDACGTGNGVAASHALAALRYASDTILTDVETICRVLERSRPG
jgi:nicotinamidase-related amidase